MKTRKTIVSVFFSLTILLTTIFIVHAEQCFPNGSITVATGNGQTLNAYVDSMGKITIYGYKSSSNYGGGRETLYGKIDNLGYFKASSDYTTVSGSVDTSCKTKTFPSVDTSYTGYCSTPYATGYTDENVCGGLAVYANMHGVGGTSQDTSTLCRQQVSEYKTRVSAYNNCLAQQAQDAKNRIISIENERDDKLKNLCSSFDSHYTYDTTLKTCVCVADYQLRNDICVSNNTIVCYRNSGDNAEMKSDGNCGCKNGYYMNENDKCVYGIKPKIDLTQDIKTYVDYGNDCFRGRIFTQSELQACNDYKSKPRYYDVNIVSTLNKATTTIIKNDDDGKNVFSRNLKIGMSGDDVKQLQILLQRLKYLPMSHTPSTYFGPITSKAVIKFQKDNKIYPMNGVLDYLTYQKITKLTK